MLRRNFLAAAAAALAGGVFAPQWGRWHRQGSGLLVRPPLLAGVDPALPLGDVTVWYEAGTLTPRVEVLSAQRVLTEGVDYSVHRGGIVVFHAPATLVRTRPRFSDERPVDWSVSPEVVCGAVLPCRAPSPGAVVRLR